jgi:hypothetical protein
MRTMAALLCGVFLAAASWPQDGASVRLPDIIVTDEEEFSEPLPRGMDIEGLGAPQSGAAPTVAPLQPQPPAGPEVPGRLRSPDLDVPVVAPQPRYELTVTAGLDVRGGLGFRVESPSRSLGAAAGVIYGGPKANPPGAAIGVAVSYAGLPDSPFGAYGRIGLLVDNAGLQAGSGTAAAEWTSRERGLDLAAGLSFTTREERVETGLGLSGSRRFDLPPLEIHVGVPAAALRHLDSELELVGSISALAGGTVGTRGLRLLLGASGTAGLSGFPIMPEASVSVEHTEDWTSWARVGQRLSAPRRNAPIWRMGDHETPSVARVFEVGSSRAGRQVDWRLRASASQVYELPAPAHPWIRGRVHGEFHRGAPVPVQADAVVTVGNPQEVQGAAWGLALVNSFSLAFINLPVNAILEGHWSGGFATDSWLPESARLCPWLPDAADWSVSAGVAGASGVWGGISLLGRDGGVGAQCALAVTW